MRVLIMAKEGNQSEAATPPTPEAMAEYQKFDEELVKAGGVLEGGRLHPRPQGKRGRFARKNRTLTHGAFAEAQEPAEGVPERPGAWLRSPAKHGAIDLVGRRKTLERKQEEIGRDRAGDQEGLDMDKPIGEEVGDDLLGLIFTACHPVLSKDARV